MTCRCRPSASASCQVAVLGDLFAPRRDGLGSSRCLKDGDLGERSDPKKLSNGESPARFDVNHDACLWFEPAMKMGEIRGNDYVYLLGHHNAYMYDVHRCTLILCHQLYILVSRTIRL